MDLFVILVMDTWFSLTLNVSDILLANSNFGGKKEIMLTILYEHYNYVYSDVFSTP